MQNIRQLATAALLMSIIVLIGAGCSFREGIKTSWEWTKETAASAGLAVKVKVRDRNLIDIDLGDEN